MRKLVLVTSASLALFMGSCLSEQALVKKYYTIEWYGPEPMEKLVTEPIDVTCEIEPIQINAIYDGNQIVNRSNTHEITYYKYHQWAVRPSVAISGIVRQHLVKSEVFEAVSTRFSRQVPDYLFEIIIRQLEVIEGEDQFSAHLHLEFRLRNNEDGQVIMDYHADKVESLAEKDLNLFTNTISNMLVNELQTFIKQIVEERSRLEAGTLE